jgi:beta-N-acetylhexosaminidase
MVERFARLSFAVLIVLSFTLPAFGQVPLRTKLGQMLMVTFTGDSLEKSSPSIDTLKRDLAQGLIGGLVVFVWANNLENPAQITHMTAELQRRSAIPLLIAVDQEGGNVARLSASNGFANTPTAYHLGTVLNQERYTRENASTMAGWLAQTGLTMNLAPVVDVNVNPSSPAIGAMERSFSADTLAVAAHASWFVDEFHKKNVVTTLKHYPGHGSAVGDSHLGFTDVTNTWSEKELWPYKSLLASGMVDAVMTAHVFNAHLDSVYPATLSYRTITGILRNSIGYRGVVVSDAMSMKAISGQYGMDHAAELAVNAGVDMLLYTRNLDSTGRSLARRMVDYLESRVNAGAISPSRIDESYARIMELKGKYLTSVPPTIAAQLPERYDLSSYPNPFNPTTTIKYEIPAGATGSRATEVKLAVYDLLGREVATLSQGPVEPGVHQVKFDGRELASGTYLCRLTAGSATITRKLLLIR